LAEREKALREEMRVAIEEASAITIESHSKTTSPEDVEAAVKAAVAARESELVALHEAALQAAAASSSSSSFVDPEVQKAEIEEAVKAAVAKALAAAQSEHASKAATQKGMLERQRTTIATLKAENAKLKEGVAVDPATPAAAVATPIARQPSIGKAGLPANPAKTKAAGQPPTGPAASTPQTTLGGPGPGTTTRAKAAAASAPQVVPTAATGGIKGAATAGRGGGAAGRGGAIAGRGGRGGNRAAGLFAGGSSSRLRFSVTDLVSLSWLMLLLSL
jgi:nucleoprotein TPR